MKKGESFWRVLLHIPDVEKQCTTPKSIFILIRTIPSCECSIPHDPPWQQEVHQPHPPPNNQQPTKPKHLISCFLIMRWLQWNGLGFAKF
jgi:hypothetical protein